MNDLELDFGDNADRCADNPPPSQDIDKQSKAKTPKMSKSKKKELDFEASLKRLETIVTEMENGRLNLEASMKHFEEGSKLANYCSSKLTETEKRVEVLLNKDSEEWQAFHYEASDTDTE